MLFVVTGAERRACAQRK